MHLDSRRIVIHLLGTHLKVFLPQPKPIANLHVMIKVSIATNIHGTQTHNNVLCSEVNALKIIIQSQITDFIEDHLAQQRYQE